MMMGVGECKGKPRVRNGVTLRGKPGEGGRVTPTGQRCDGGGSL